MKNPLYAMIDLSSEKIELFPISEELFKNHLGGKILASKLLYDLTEPGIDPLSEESIIIVNTSAMTGTGGPCTSRFNMSFKNVLTGGIASSNSGGTFGLQLKRAGFDGLIIKGKAQKPTLIKIADGKISLEDASDFWGLDTEETQEKLPPHYGKLVIGPAGENLVRYASVASGERMSGRGGGGAVFGSKNLKALIAYGTKKVELYDKEGFKKYVKKWNEYLRSHPITGGRLPLYGTANMVNQTNGNHALPTRNFQVGYFKDAEKISGERLAETSLVRNSGCVSCPIRCERRVSVQGKEVKGPEFETIGLFGSNMDNDDLDLINEINYAADLMGMDTISLAGSIAFAMELYEKGKADFGLHFGEVKELPEVIRKIAQRETELYDLGEGVKRMSVIYGGENYAIHSKGLELSSYEPRQSVGMGLGYATSNRGGCHLNGGYLALMEATGLISFGKTTTKGKAEWTILFQDLMEAVSGAGFCLFTLQSFIPPALFKLKEHTLTKMGKSILALYPAISLSNKNKALMPFNNLYFPHAKAIELATGIPLNTGKLSFIGERGFNLERLYNLREGLTSQDDSLPSRLTDEAQDPNNPSSRVRLDLMLPAYYKGRGWDEKGVPTDKTKKKLGLGAL